MNTHPSQRSAASPARAGRPFRDRPITVGAVCFILVVCVAWGGAAPAIKLALKGIPPLAMAAWRLLIGLLCLGLWCWARGVNWWIGPRFQPALIGFAVLLVFRIGLINVGLQFTTSNHAVVFINTNPFFVAAFAHFLFPGDRLDAWKRAGLLVAFVGLGIVFLEGTGGQADRPLLGDSLIVVSGLVLATDQICAKFLVRRHSPLQIVIWQFIYGAPLFFLLSFLFERETSVSLTPDVIVSLLYQGVFAAAFCFVGWNYMLQHYRASQVSAYRFSIPFFGSLLSWLVLGEQISAKFALGVVLVASGIYLVSQTRATQDSIDVLT